MVDCVKSDVEAALNIIVLVSVIAAALILLKEVSVRSRFAPLELMMLVGIGIHDVELVVV